MASDAESDVSAITLSDDDAPKHKAPARPKSAPKATGGAGGSAATGSVAAAAGSKSAGKSKHRKVRVAFQMPVDGSDGEDDTTGAGLNNGYVDGDGADPEGGEGAVEDETKPLGWSYFRKRDTSEGPATWGEVDAGELRFVAESLVRSTTKRASQADDVIQQIFKAEPGDEDYLVTDPLGRGVIDPGTLTLGKRSKMARLGQSSGGGGGLKATMRTFRTARHSSKQQQGGSEGGSGSSPAASGTRGFDEETRKVLPNQEGFDPEAYLAAFHAESGMGQLEKGMRSLSRELSERTGQLKLLIRNNFDRFINCKDAIDDIHAKMRKTLVRGGGGGTVGGPPPSGASAASAVAAGQSPQQPQGVGTDRVFRSLEQVEAQARRTFGPILDRAAKADRIRAVSSLLQRFDHLFAAPQRMLELAGRGELEQVVREFKRANMLIRPTPTTARVWISLYGEIEKRVTEVYLAVKQLVTEPLPEGRPMGQDGPATLFGVAPNAASAAGDGSGGGEDPGQERLHQLPDYLLFLTLVRQERLSAARDEDAMRLYVSRLETHVDARIQACDKHHTEQLGQLVTAWMRATAGSGGGAGGSTPAAAARTPLVVAAAGGVASLQASFSSLSLIDSPGARRDPNSAGAAPGRAGAGEGDSDDDDDALEDDDMDEDGEAAESAFLLWQGGAAASSPFLTTASLPYHIRMELPRLVQDPGGPFGASGSGAASSAVGTTGMYGAAGAAGTEPLPISAHAPEPQLTAAQRQWVSYVCSVSALLLWSLPGLWATCHSPKYGNNADLDEQSREGLERGRSLARRLVESLCAKYALRLRRAAQSLARAGPMQPGLPLIIKDACHLWTSLDRMGITSRTLSLLRGGALAALALHVGVLGDHLAGLPELLFGADDFRLDLLAADQQPVTALPRRLEEEMGVALLHYQWALRAVAGSMGEVPAESGWRPMQGHIFACFALLSEALAEYARGLYGGRGAGDGESSSGSRSKIASRSSTELELAGGATAGGAGAAATPGPGARRAGLAAGGVGATSPGVGARSTSEEPDGVGDDGRMWSANGGSSNHDVRVLLVISNSAVIRTRVMPGVVKRYHRLLAPTPDAEVTRQRRLHELTTAMRRSNEALGSSYLARKEADVQAAVERYVTLGTAPLLGAATAANAAGTGTAAASKRGAKVAVAPVVRELAGPPGPSAGCCALLQLLTAIHNEALAYSPSNLRSFMEALAERLVGEIMPACQGLAGAGAGKKGSVEQLVQLWADLAFLTAALRPLLTEELAADLHEAKVALGAAIAVRQRVRRYRPTSAPAAAVAGITDGEELSDALQGLLSADVEAWLQRHALNVRSFAAAPAAAPATAAAPPAPAIATTSGGGGKVARAEARPSGAGRGQKSGEVSPRQPQRDARKAAARAASDAIPETLEIRPERSRRSAI